jgi:hypothetical protein
VTPVEQLFLHELEYHRQLRTVGATHADAAAAHTSYALQHGYEELMRESGTTTGHQVEGLAARFTFAGDTRDVLAARDSLKTLLGIPLLEK